MHPTDHPTSSKPPERQNARWIAAQARNARIPAFLVLLVVLFYWNVLTAPADHIVGGNDMANLFQVWLEEARWAVHHGQLPLWTPYLASGMAFHADPEPALFYPPTWLAFAMPATRALGVILAGHVAWAAIGCYGWLRRQDSTLAGALAGAALFAFSGYTFARIQGGHQGVLTTGSWLPWGLWAIDALKGSAKWRRSVALGSLAVGACFLAGHPPTFLLVSVMWGAYALNVAWSQPHRHRWGLVVKSVLMGALGLCLAAVQVLPFAQVLATSTRIGSGDYEFGSWFSWPIGYLVTLLVPNFFGEPVRTGYWGEGVHEELIFYVGVLALMLSWVALRSREKIRFWVGTSVGALFFAFGGYSAVHPLIARVVPWLNAVRAPARAGFLFTLGAAVLTASALTALERADETERRRLVEPFRGRWVGTTLGATAVLAVICYGLFAWGRDSNPSAGRMWHLAGAVATFGLFFVLAIGYLRQWEKPQVGRWMPLLATALLLLDLWTLGVGLVRTVPAPHSAYWRIVSGHVDPAAGRVLPWGLSIFEQNGALTFRVRSVFAYHTLEDEQYNRVVSSVPDPRARAYDLLNTAYVVTINPLVLTSGDTLSLLAEESGVYIYRRSTQLPGAWVVPSVRLVRAAELLDEVNNPSLDPRHEALVTGAPDGFSCEGGAATGARVLLDQEDQVSVQVEGDGGFLVLSQRYAPGWRVVIDGQPVRSLRTFGMLHGVCVAPGEHTVTFAYRPGTLVAGAGLSAFALVGVLLLLWYPSRRRTHVYENTAL
jgi:hypothetical protein